jgi:hypothetical protein
MRNYAVLTVNAALAALLMAGSVAHAANPKACDLLNAQTAASLLGGPVGAAIDMGGIGCSYSTKSEAATIAFMVTDMGGMTVDEFRRTMQAGTRAGGTEEISGPGEARFSQRRRRGPERAECLLPSQKCEARRTEKDDAGTQDTNG